jgi:hypothetical protein
MLTVTEPASDPALLTQEEVLTAIGSPAGITSDRLRDLSLRVSELIADTCNVALAGSAVRTLRAETLEETLRVRCPQERLTLARGPILSVTSVTEDGTTLDAADYEVDGFSLVRLSSGYPSWWSSCGRIVIAYRAGWETVPAGLKEAASKLAARLFFDAGRDTSLGSVDIPGLIAATYRYGRPDDPLISTDIMQALRDGRYINTRDMVA